MESDGDSPMVRLIWVLGVAAVTTGILSLVAFRGWIPHDEGTLGQTAVRILDGQWPHIDFLDVYPGLQGFFHAGVFLVLGESIASLRVAWLFIGATAAVSLFELLRRVLGRAYATLAAISVTVLAFAVYPSSVPSWWNVSLGLAALVLLLYGTEHESKPMLFGAGLLLGVSILVKTTGGLLFAIPAATWLVARSELDRRWNIGVGLAGAAIYLTILVPAMSVGRVVLIGIPAIGSVVLLARSGLKKAGDGSGVSSDVRYVLSFAAGVLVLPMMVVMGYAIGGHIDDLVEGWIVSPALRYEAAEGDIPISFATLLVGSTLAIVGLFARRRGLRPSLLVGLGLVGLLLWSLLDWYVFGRFIFGLAAWIPVALLAVGYFLWDRWDDRVVLLVSAGLAFTMIQIPVWNGFYSAYTIPTTALALLVVLGSRMRKVSVLVAVVAAIFLGQSLVGRLSGPEATAEAVEYIDLQSERAGIAVPVSYQFYDPLIEKVSAISKDAIYAGPDSPEVSFLADVPSATAGFFEVLDVDWTADIPVQLAKEGVPLAINSEPQFSEPLPAHDLRRIYAALERTESFGSFELRWRDES